MKKTFTVLFSIVLIIQGFTQNHPEVSKTFRNIAVIKPNPQAEANAFTGNSSSMMKSTAFDPEETPVGLTRYDDQSNASMQNRIYLYTDGTIGATWIQGLEDDLFDDRGSGYNYFDGNSWGPIPTERIEDERVGWPSYSPLGENGEIVVSHTGAMGLKIASRPDKGTGDWNFSGLLGPDGHHMLWNRSITSGVDHNRVHILGLTAPIAYSGTPYEGLDGALVYSLSTDGGQTWDIENTILDGMTTNEYYGFSSDTYTWAEPKGDVLAFVVGESWTDLFLMKSTDGGQTFEKTMIWENPYPFYDPNTPTVTDTFYCADGASSLIIDNDDMVHVVFGINRALGDASGTYWFPFVDGIGYWNENMPAFSNNKNALSPYGDPGSELVDNYNLIGWTQDVDGDGQITFVGTATTNIGTYYLGLSSMPQLAYDQNNKLLLIFASVTETYDNGVANYRHLWARPSLDDGVTWGDFYDLTSGLIHIFDECVYPSCAANSDDFVYLLYQKDNEPGNAVWGAQHPYDNNDIVFMKVNKAEVGLVGVQEHKSGLTDADVSQNFPNPFEQTTEIAINLKKQANVDIEVTNTTGQRMFFRTIQNAKPGMNKVTLDAGDFTPGVYFYTVKAVGSSVTKKMVVE